MSKDVDLIKERIDLADFLRSYITLHPAGKNFKALCPFHQEKTPSFIVSPERKRWHCFGCGEDGDLVTFVMKYENLEFPEALRVLAEKAGIELQSVNPALQKEYGLLYGLHDDATAFYKEALLKNEKARAYLKNRGLTEETIADFNLGFSPGGDLLTLHLIKKGYDVLDIARAGLAYKTARGLYRDRFNQRIMFPIANHLGKTVAFTGRIMPEAEANADPNSIDAAKYVNSPETPIFNKSKILYGLHASKGAIAKSRTATLVEGQMDFLMMWQTGIKNAVAVSGTGLTPHHLERLRRLADTVIVNFDNDEAGLKALERALDVFGGFDFHLKVLNLGEFKDAAEACRAEPEYVLQAMEWAKPAFNHLFGFYFGKEKTLSIPERKRVLRHLLQKIKSLKSAVEQNIWIRELAAASGIGENALLSEMASISDTRKDPVEAPQSGPAGERRRVDLISGRLISLAFTKPQFLEELQSKKSIFPAIYHPVIDDPKQEKAAMFDLRSAVDFADIPSEDIQREFALLMRHLEIEHLKEDRAALQEKIRVGRVSWSEKELEDRMVEFYTLSKKIDEFQSAV